MSVIVEFSLFPMDKGQSVGAYVARAAAIVRQSGLPAVLGPMGTCLEGEYDQVMEVVGRCVKALEPDCERIYMTVKMDWRRGRAGGLTGKLASVEERLGAEAGGQPQS